ncbi:hypothetical protein HZB01_05510 [Candidatus Woesearchaeota archaeon]|nr:hypothetical protein [Candidatus Woesearchaeota archaeon]
MGERTIVVDNEEIRYSGIFPLTEFFDEVSRWIREKGYDEWEKHNYEQRFPSGRQIELWLEPWRKISDYAKYVFKIELLFRNINDVEVYDTQTKKKRIMQKGDIFVNISGFLIFDYFGKWDRKSYFVFLRALFDRYVYTQDSETYRQGLIYEANQLRDIMKRYLNIYRTRYRAGGMTGTVDTRMGEHLAPQSTVIGQY